MVNLQSRHTVVCQWPRKTQDIRCDIYKISTPCKNSLTDFYQIYILMLYIYMTLHIKFESNQVSGGKYTLS